MQQPFWENIYRSDGVSTFGAAPNRTLLAYEPLLPRDGALLDVGCGEGQNALYLAGRGYEVEAFDLSQRAVDKVRRLAERRQTSLRVWAEDLCAFPFARDYGGILSFGTLHFVPRRQWRAFLQRAKVHTQPGGLNVIQLFTDRAPASPDIAPFAVGLAREGEPLGLYRDWEALRFSSDTFEDEHPGVPRHVHDSNKIVARRPGGGTHEDR